MGTNYIAPIWRMPENTNKDKLSNYTIRWDNTNQGILTAPLEDFGIDNTFSFSLWAKPNSDITLSSYAHLFSNTQLTSGGFGLYLAGDGDDSGTSGDLCFRFYVDNYNISGRFINSEPINTEQWYHVVVTYSDAAGASMYIDNASPITGISGRTAAAPNVSVGIGCAVSPVYGIRYQAKSSISEVCLFDYIISADQVQYLYNLNNPMVIPGGEPVGYWRIGSNSNPLALAGYPNTSVGADSVFEFSTQDNIESPHIDMTGAMSISGWFKTTDTGYNMIYHEDLQIRTGGNRNWFFTTQGNLLRFSQFYNNGTFDNVSSSGITVNDGNWHHGVFVWDGTTNVDSMKIFVDGILRGKTTASSTNRNNHNVTGMIGSSNVNYNMIGELSNIQIWDANLTYGTASNLEDVAGGQVAELYNNGQPLMSGTQPQETNLKAWYKLNQYDSYWDLGGNGKWTFNNAAIN